MQASRNRCLPRRGAGGLLGGPVQPMPPQGPIIDKLSVEMSGPDLKVAKLNVDENPETAQIRHHEHPDACGVHEL